jgi:hypothetical protein
VQLPSCSGSSQMQFQSCIGVVLCYGGVKSRDPKGLGKKTVFEELGLYAELLIFVIGTFLYGFLTREIIRNPTINGGNRAFLALATSLTR